MARTRCRPFARRALLISPIQTSSNLLAIWALDPDAIPIESDAPGLHVAEHVTGTTQEYDAVTGRIRFVPFEFVVRDFDLGSDVDVRPAARRVIPVIGDPRVGLAVSDMDFICPVGVGFAAAGCIRNVRLHQGLIPLTDSGIYRVPLSEITSIRTSN